MVISGRFPNGRPAWEDAGARLVEDITPYEQRKLWLLNASHSLLAYAASIRGHTTIDEAIADPQCRPGSRRSGTSPAVTSLCRRTCSMTTAPRCHSRLGVLETLHSGLGEDTALVDLITEQMEALTEQR